MKKLLMSAVLLSASSLFAAISPNFVSVSPSSGGFTYNYTVTIAGDQNAVAGVSPPGVSTPAGANVASGVQSDYFTIYDFIGYTGVHAEPGNWTLQTLPGNLGSTPQTVNVIPADNPNVVNLTWYINNGTITGPATITGFSAESRFGGTTPLFFSGQGTRNTAPVGTEISNSGTVEGPGGVPEPATYALIGSSLAALGLVRRRS